MASLEHTSRQLGDARVALSRMTAQRERVASRLSSAAQSKDLSPEARASQVKALTLEHSSIVAECSIKAIEVDSLENEVAAMRTI